MSGAIVVIDQPTGAGGGTPGVARQDLWQAQQINLSVGIGGNSTFQWDLLDVPPGSASSLTGPTTATPNFTPDLIGTYRVQLITNGGGTGNVQILVARVRFDSTGLLVNRGWAPPAFGERNGESNYGGNIRGWAQELEFILADILGNAFAGGSPSPTWSISVIETGNCAAAYGQILRCDSTGSGFSVSLPTAAGNDGKGIRVKLVTSTPNPVVLQPFGIQTIDGASSLTLSASRAHVELASDGTNLMVVG